MQIQHSENKKSWSLQISRIFSSEYFGIFSFTFLTAIAAQITIPVKPVPFTLQTMAVVLSGAFLGKKNGAYSQFLYLVAGAVGLPVFAFIPDAGYGFARLFSPTGGFLLSFPLAAYLTGVLMEKNKSYVNVVLSMFLGEILIIFSGALFLNSFFVHNLFETFKSAVTIFSVWTVIKVIAASTIFFGLKRK